MKIKYNKIGVDYNLTRKADPFLTKQLLYHLNPKRNAIYLDIGCGTGNYTNEFQKKGFQCIGIDPSKKMLEKARAKNKDIVWKIGSAESTGLSNNSVDGIIGSLTIHHWTDLEKSFLELKRVLKPNGKIVIFTSTPEQMKGYWLNHYFPKMMADSIKQMPTFVTIESAMKNAGIELLETDMYAVKPNLQDQFLYCGKQNPEFYFNDQIRHGISSFSSLANKTEVDQGLIDLRKDIDSRKFHKITRTYQNNLGDYLYIIGKI